MPLSTDVALPLDHAIQFPGCCIICGRRHPDSHLLLQAEVTGWLSQLRRFAPGSRQLQVPACTGCTQLYSRRRQLTALIVWSTAAVLTWLLLPQIRQIVPRGLEKPAILICIGLCLMPVILYEVFRPVAVELIRHKDHIELQFAEFDRAIDFVAVNVTAPWIRLNGQLMTDADRFSAGLVAESRNEEQ